MAKKRISESKALGMAGRYFRRLLALVLVVAALTNLTYAWLELDKKNNLSSKSYITVSADGILMETADGITDEITVSNVGDGLVECSSVDGQNIYLPTGEDSDITDESAYDGGMKFRKANVNDLNTKYIAIEFILTADKDTDVWLSNESFIFGTAADAVRVSLNVVDENEIIVFDSSESYVFDASKTNDPKETTVVGSIDESGNAKADTQKVFALSDYFYTAYSDKSGNITGTDDTNRLLELKSGVSRKIVLTVWLEGCDEDCDNRVYGKTDLRIQLKFTAGMKNPRVIKFSDCTYESWAYLKGLRSLDDNLSDSAYKRVLMRDVETDTLYMMVRADPDGESGTGETELFHWTATVPSTVKNVEFIRLYHNTDYSSTDEWEYWSAGAIRTYSSIPLLRYYALDCGRLGAETSNSGFWTDETSVMTLYFCDARTTVTTTNLSFSLNTKYADGKAETYSLAMSVRFDVDSDDGDATADEATVYAVRIPTAAQSSFVFTQSEYGTTYKASYRSYTTYNLCTVTDISNSTVRWSVGDSSEYPT